MGTVVERRDDDLAWPPQRRPGSGPRRCGRSPAAWWTPWSPTPVLQQIAKVRATADWLESAVGTGNLTLDEGLPAQPGRPPLHTSTISNHPRSVTIPTRLSGCRRLTRPPWEPSAPATDRLPHRRHAVGLHHPATR
ncbi:DUF6192 family protein [Actinomadura yumaensis]|uniref:DUF6192 family protein n=1 Tax=Actinomadura yumaensis TaxID=111807 RepID=UPI0036117DBE